MAPEAALSVWEVYYCSSVVKILREKSRGAASDAHSDGSISMLTKREITDITDISQNPDFGQNLKISFVLRALNHYKRFVSQLRFA